MAKKKATKARASKKSTKKKATKRTAKKKSAKKAKPSLNELYNEVARKADTDKLQINAAETKRVLACLFDVLEDYKAAEAFDLVAKGLQQAAGRRR